MFPAPQQHTARTGHVFNLLLVFAILISLTPTTYAAPRMLSDLRIAGPFGSDVADVLFVGDRVVFRSDLAEEGRFALYSTSLTNGGLTPLSADLPAGVVSGVVAAADRVIFTLELDAGKQQHLYSVPAAGGTPIRLTPDYATSDTATELMQVLVVGDQVYYTSDQEQADAVALYRVPLLGGTSTRISVDLPAAGDTPWLVQQISLSADKRVLAYSITNLANFSTHIYSFDLAASTTVQLTNDTFQMTNLNSERFYLTSDGSRVLYRSNNDDALGFALISVASDGSDRQKLIIADTLAWFNVNADNSQALVARFDPSTYIIDLLSIPIGGGSATTLSDSIRIVSGNPGAISNPAGDRIYFVHSDGNLMAVPIAGGSPETIFSAGSAHLWSATFSADGTWLLFEASDSSGATGLFRYNTTTNEPATAVVPSELGTYSGNRLIAGDQLLLRVFPPTGPSILYRTAIAGGTFTNLNHVYAAGEDNLMLLAADGNTLVYGAGFRSAESIYHKSTRLLHTSIDGTQPAVVIAASQANIGDVGSIAVSAPDQRAVYLADKTFDTINELFSVGLDGGVPLRLSPLPSGAPLDNPSVSAFYLDPQGGRVAYQTYHPAQGRRLFVVAIEGGTPAEISGFAANLEVQDLQFSPRGDTIIFRTIDDTSTIAGTLYRAPASGGNAEALDQQVNGLMFSPNGAFIVYERLAYPNQRRSIAVDGDTSTMLGATSLGFTPSKAAISADSAYVIHSRLNFGVSLVPQLEIQPIDGSGESLPVQEFADGEMIWGWDLSADRTSVVYVLTTDDNRTLLRRKSFDGTAAQTLYEVSDAEITLLGAVGAQQVLFSILTSEGMLSVATLALSGGEPTVLYGPNEGRRITARMSPNEAFALFELDLDIYAVSLRGGTPTPLNQSTVAESQVFLDDAMLSDDGRIVFTDRDQLWVADLLTGNPQVIATPLPPDRITAIVGDTVIYRSRNVLIPERFFYTRYDLYAVDLPIPATPELEVTQTTFQLTENEANPQIALRLSAAQARTIRVNYQVSGGSAVAGEDYNLEAGPLVFAPGEVTAYLPLTLIDRPGVQGERTIEISVSDPALATTGQVAASVISITISDSVPPSLYLPLLGR